VRLRRPALRSPRWTALRGPGRFWHTPVRPAGLALASPREVTARCSSRPARWPRRSWRADPELAVPSGPAPGLERQAPGRPPPGFDWSVHRLRATASLIPCHVPGSTSRSTTTREYADPLPASLHRLEPHPYQSLGPPMGNGGMSLAAAPGRGGAPCDRPASCQRQDPALRAGDLLMPGGAGGGPRPHGWKSTPWPVNGPSGAWRLRRPVPSGGHPRSGLSRSLGATQ